MSLDLKVSFFNKVKTELKTLFTHTPNWEVSASATLTYVAPMVESIVTLVDPTAAPTLNASIARVQAAMAAASVVIKEAGPQPTLAKYLHAILDDAGELANVSGIKDPQTLLRLASVVNTITAEVNAILDQASETQPSA